MTACLNLAKDREQYTRSRVRLSTHSKGKSRNIKHTTDSINQIVSHDTEETLIVQVTNNYAEAHHS